ncbi:MAG: response regulator transcription factor [Gammaproteobacteria bacterium]|nr:response regulator transcription factor [Gammaproteobacteria bacterium]
MKRQTRLRTIESHATVLVVEDDENILQLLSAYLESAGYTVIIAADGADGMRKALHERFDIGVLDVMLPNKSGIEIASALRRSDREMPILFLTALGNETDVLNGFEAGADDYMVKPFSPRELLVRIAAILKRFRTQGSHSDSIVHCGPIELDDSQAICRVHGRPVELTPHEYKILRQLMQRPSRIYERQALIASIYGNQHAVSPKAIDVHVHHLRTKLGSEAGDMIQTVRGFGYRLLTDIEHTRARHATATPA